MLARACLQEVRADMMHDQDSVWVKGNTIAVEVHVCGIGCLLQG